MDAQPTTDSSPNNIVSVNPEPRVYDVNKDVAQKQSNILTKPIILGDLVLASPTTQTTIGANGAATALTANPVGYLTIMIGTTAMQIPYYNMA